MEVNTPIAPAAKKPAKKVSKAKPAKAKVDRSMADVPTAERRIKLVQLLRKLGATTSGTAQPVSRLAAKLGYTNYDVYCLGYAKYPLFAEGFLKHADVEGSREKHFYLTAKGQKQLPE